MADGAMDSDFPTKPPRPPTDVFGDPPAPHRRTKNKLHRLTGILLVATGAVTG